MHDSHFKEGRPLGCKHETKAGHSKPYGESLQAQLDTITQGTYDRIVVNSKCEIKVDTHKPNGLKHKRHQGCIHLMIDVLSFRQIVGI